jgi:hypothetical protein
MEELPMRCKKSDGTYTTVTWRFFYPQCTRANIVSGVCHGKAGAYVAAVTVKRQQIYLLPFFV